MEIDKYKQIIFSPEMQNKISEWLINLINPCYKNFVIELKEKNPELVTNTQNEIFNHLKNYIKENKNDNENKNTIFSYVNSETQESNIENDIIFSIIIDQYVSALIKKVEEIAHNITKQHWIQNHGSLQLQEAYINNNNVHFVYIFERLNMELPQFYIINENELTETFSLNETFSHLVYNCAYQLSHNYRVYPAKDLRTKTEVVLLDFYGTFIYCQLKDLLKTKKLVSIN